MAVVIDCSQIRRIIGATFCHRHNMVDFVRRTNAVLSPAFIALADEVVAPQHLVT
jgi:hypothetical protein